MVCREVRAFLLASEPRAAEVQQHLATCLSCAHAAEAVSRLDAALRNTLLVPLPPRWERLGEGALSEAKTDFALRNALVIEPPPQLQARLQALAEEPESWLVAVWNTVRARPSVLAGQLAALAVLAYSLVQLFAWIGSLPIVLGDVPYAIELLLLSPAADYLSQLEPLIQQLGLWLLVAGAGLLAAQGLPPRRQPEP